MNNIEPIPFNPKKHIKFEAVELNDFQTEVTATVQFDVSMRIDNRELKAYPDILSAVKENLATHILHSIYGQITKDARDAYRDYQMSSNCGPMSSFNFEPTLDSNLKRFLINSMNICNPRTTSLNT